MGKAKDKFTLDIEVSIKSVLFDTVNIETTIRHSLAEKGKARASCENKATHSISTTDSITKLNRSEQ